MAQAQIRLLQPLGNQGTIPVQPGIGTLIAYTNDALNWLFDVALGLTVLLIVVSGIQIMFSAGSNGIFGSLDEARSRITWAIIGLMVLFFSGLILQVLNDTFYV